MVRKIKFLERRFLPNASASVAYQPCANSSAFSSRPGRPTRDTSTTTSQLWCASSGDGRNASSARAPDARVVETREAEQHHRPGRWLRHCETPLSAHVNQRVGGGLKSVGRFREFTQLGASGVIIDMWPIEITGDDAMAIEGSLMSQGYLSSYLELFAFRAGALVDLGPESKVVLIANDGRAKDASEAIVVAESWFFDPADKTVLVVD